MFTSYLHKNIVGQLKQLYDFMEVVNKGLDEDMENLSDKNALMTVMRHIRDVRNSMDNVAQMFDPLWAEVRLLQKHNVGSFAENIGDQPVIDFLEEAPDLWESVVNKAFKKREKIQGLQNAMADKVREDTVKFKNDIENFCARMFAQGPFNNVPTGPDAVTQAYAMLDEYNAELSELALKREHYSLMESLFELQTTKHVDVEMAKEALFDVKKVWDLSEMVQLQIDSWKQELWVDLEAESYIVTARNFLKQVQGLKKKVRKRAVYKQLLTNIQTMVISSP